MSPRRALFLIALATGCGGAAPPIATAAPRSTDVRAYFPLEPGTVWSYEVDTGEGSPTFATARVLSAGPEGAQMQTNGLAPTLYLSDAGSVRRQGSEGFLLHGPIAVGTTFVGDGGLPARIESIDATVRTGMGELRRCVLVVTVGGEYGQSIATTYCPDVGPASIVTSLESPSTGQRFDVRATLIGVTHGAPAPDGTTVTH